jgi:hypothetical protein
MKALSQQKITFWEAAELLRKGLEFAPTLCQEKFKVCSRLPRPYNN